VVHHRKQKADGLQTPKSRPTPAPHLLPLADVNHKSYPSSMRQNRHSWLRTQKDDDGASVITNRVPQPPFRSDNDLYQWWMWGRVAIPMTILCYGALRSFGVPFDYTPLATLPAVFFFLLLRLLAWKDRKDGKRFSHYDTDDLFR
jgi:hypothetical protein